MTRPEDTAKAPDPAGAATAPAVPRPPRRRAGRGARVLLGLLALLLVAAPFAAAWRYDAFRRAVTAQEAPPGTGDAVPPTAPGAASSVHRAPVVLAYHDVARDGRSRYSVTPEAFEAQVAALSRAGYRSLDSAEFLAFLRDGRTPAPRSVFLTFDDGTHGLWVHADRVLAKYGMKAAVFLITGQVGRHRPYYLSWEEVERMDRSGRWDFQDHTHDLHHRAPADRAGRAVPALGNRLWLPGRERVETPVEYRERVERDLDRSLREFAAHRLPRPRLFAFPFSETAGSPEGPRAGAAGAADDRILTEALRARFDVRFTNNSERPLPAGVRAAAEGQVQRLEVTRETGAPQLLAALARQAPVPPAACPSPLAEPDQWHRTDGSGRTGLATLTGTGPYPGPVGYAAAAYRPVSSADWTGYTVRATVDRLQEAKNNASLVVRDRSREPVTVSFSHSYVRVLTGIGDGRREIARRTLDEGPSHELAVTVEEGRTVVLVDGTVRIEHRNARIKGGDATGGIAFSTRTGQAGVPYPRLAAMTVAPVSAPAAKAAR